MTTAAFGEGSGLTDAVTGQITDAACRSEVAQRLAALSESGSAEAAVAEWSEPSGTVDTEVLALVRSARGAGWQIGLLTHATTRLRDDLARLELEHEFDAIFNSAELGSAKPDPAVFRVACRQLSVEPERCVFVDDSPANITAAAHVGLAAHLYEEVPSLAVLLGVAPADPRA